MMNGKSRETRETVDGLSFIVHCPPFISALTQPLDEIEIVVEKKIFLHKS
jgi:hypothetical protein